MRSYGRCEGGIFPDIRTEKIMGNGYKRNISDHLALGYGSKYQLLRMLGWHREEFNEIIADGDSANITWKDFKFNGSEDHELMNAEFLDKETESDWENIWPTNEGKNGLNWDAVGTDDKTWYLIEAKARLVEFGSAKEGGGKKQENQDKVNEAFTAFQKCYNITTQVDWRNGTFYQIANRLVFLEFLKKKGIDAKLIYVLFLNGFEFNTVCSMRA